MLRVFRGRALAVISAGDAFDFDAGVMAEVDEQTDAMTGGLEIIVNLSAMLVGQFLHRLEFHDHLAEIGRAHV